MSIIDILYTILIGPLELIFEVIYMIANRVIGHPGIAIVVLSLIMNFLVLPLYKRSDAMQEEARKIDEKLAKGVVHIKKTFTGDERMMILQTYYRQNNYKPTDALNGSVSLLLEVPFFMAAYNFLSHLGAIQGVSLGPIADLGAPDGMITIAGLTINVLPILMTLVNLISSAIYVKGFPLKTKIQLFGMALFFLVFLYTSPAGLVFYWTLNNVFSLVKTLFYKLENPKKVLSIMFSVIGTIILGFGVFVYDSPSLKRTLFLIILGIVCEVPMILMMLKDRFHMSKKSVEVKNDRKIFVLGGLFLTVLVGVLIPSTLIAASPQEFIDINYFHNPIWYIVNAACLAAGTFLVWFGVFYWISSAAGKSIFDKLIWILCGIMLVNYMFFGTDLGIISSNLQYENGVVFDAIQELGNVLILGVVALVMYLIISKFKNVVTGVIRTALIALAGMSGLNMMTIQGSVAEVEELVAEIEENTPHFNLSKNGKNVIVLMLDRGMGQYVPYMFNEKPELKEQFDGFTYYSNTISFGGFTNFGTPALFGGYEYTPIELNKRDSELLVDKQNEALKVMPVVFNENNYEVTVCDPPYANYQWVPDLSIYSDYSEIQTYITEGAFTNTELKAYAIEKNRRNFFCLGIMKSMPLFLQETIYSGGTYNQAEVSNEEEVYSTQVAHSNTVSEGMNSVFMEAYNVLLNLSNMTKISEEETNTFLMMSNNATHEPMLLQEPEYEPAQYVDNTLYFDENSEKYMYNGMQLKMEERNQVAHYHVNMAAMIRLGEWFDYMKENDVYDNTKIIIVSDHGRPLGQLDELMLGDGEAATNDLEYYFPLLMVKDFDSKGFTVSDEFMTNADVPTMAFEGTIENPTNPFTGKEICNEEKILHDQYIITSDIIDLSINNGTTFLPSKWLAISEDIWDKENWKVIDEEVVIPQEIQ